MNCNASFQANPALLIGLILNCVSQIVRHTVNPQGTLSKALHFTMGAAVGLMLVGLLYGFPRTRPLFDAFHAFKQRLLGQ